MVEDCEALVEAARKPRPDVFVADIAMPRLNGFEALTRLKEDDPHVKVVFLTMHPEDAYVRRALEAGASGYVLKHSAPAELITAIRAALDHETYVTPTMAGAMLPATQHGLAMTGDREGPLTPRQQEILQLLIDGNSAKEIARQLGISPRTVEFHKHQMMEPPGISSTPKLVRWAIKQGLVTI